MKSLRLSLMVYFLALLALALGAASWLLYRIADQALVNKKKSTAKLIEEQYNNSCDAKKIELDNTLLYQAQNLANLAQFRFDRHQVRYISFLSDWDRLHRDVRGSMGAGQRIDPQLHILGMLSSSLVPGGYANAAGWAVEGSAETFSLERARNRFTDINIEPQDLSQDTRVAEYFQIDTSWGSTLHSPTLGSRIMPIDVGAFSSDRLLDLKYDDLVLEGDKPVHLRRVRIRASNTRWSPLPPPHPGNGPQWPPPPTGPPGNPGRRQPPPPSIIVQCAYDVRNVDPEFQGIKESRDKALATLEQENDASLASLRQNLWIISTLTFLATVFGCIFLVRQGLLPVQRLCDAMGEISPKDFQLPLNPAGLPTELRPIAIRLTETLEMLKRAFAREKQATADISHELRTPLAALLTTTELALRKSRTAEEYREFLADCHLSGQQMNKAVERLLTLARLDAGVEHMRSREIDAADVARQCAAVVRPLVEARGLSLGLSCAPALLRTDPDKLREILNNLLHNAIQYNQPGGAIDLKVHSDGDRTVLEVSDTGIGIAPEARPHIFERFYRADRSRGTDGLHAGLGLAIVKEYVELMKGDINVDSTVGRGTTFHLSLPCSPLAS